MARRRLPPPPPGGRRAAPEFLTITLDGPFFTRDPGKTVDANIMALMDKLAAVGEAEVRARLYPSKSAMSAGPYIRGRTSSLKGRRWKGYAVVSSTDPSLSGEEQRRVNAQLSGRRVATVQRVFRATVPSRMGRRIGTTKGAQARKAFAAVARLWRSIARSANLTKGL